MTTEPTPQATPMTIDDALTLWRRVHAESRGRVVCVIQMGEGGRRDTDPPWLEIIHNAAEWEALRARLESE